MDTLPTSGTVTLPGPPQGRRGVPDPGCTIRPGLSSTDDPLVRTGPGHLERGQPQLLTSELCALPDHLPLARNYAKAG